MSCLHPEQIQAYLEVDLSAAERQKIEDHISICSACRTALQSEQEFDHLLCAEPLLRAPSGFRERVLAQIRARKAIRSYPEWFWALGLGLAAAAIGLFLGSMGKPAFQPILQKAVQVESRGGLDKLIQFFASLPTTDLLAQIPAAHPVFLTNFAVCAVVLCWGLWQMVKALRR